MTRWLMPVVLAAAFGGLFAAPARAEDVITVRVPFSFVLNGRTFAPGRYEIGRDNVVLSFYRLDGGGGSFAIGIEAGGTNPARGLPVLEFVRYENTYRLAEVWLDDQTAFAFVPRKRAGSSVAEADPAPPTLIVGSVARASH